MLQISAPINNFYLFGRNLPEKRIFPVKNRKNERHYRILHTRISLITKFQLKLTILILMDHLCEKRYFLLKTEKVN